MTFASASPSGFQKGLGVGRFAHRFAHRSPCCHCHALSCWLPVADQEWNREWAVDMVGSVPSLGLIAQDFACAELYPVATFFFLTFYFHMAGGGDVIWQFNACMYKYTYFKGGTVCRDAEGEGGEVLLLRWVVLCGAVVVVAPHIFSKKSRTDTRCASPDS